MSVFAARVDRVAKVQSSNAASPTTIKQHQLYLSISDLSLHQIQAGQAVWIRTTQQRQQSASSSAQWLLMKAWPNQQLASGLVRIALSSTVYHDNSKKIQVGEMVNICPLAAPLLSAKSLALSPPLVYHDPTFHHAMHMYIAQSLQGSLCYDQMMIDITLFQHSYSFEISNIIPVISKVSSAPSSLSSSSSSSSYPPSLYIIDKDTNIQFQSSSQRSEEAEAEANKLDFCQQMNNKQQHHQQYMSIDTGRLQ